jgi:Right handed beta helix region
MAMFIKLRLSIVAVIAVLAGMLAAVPASAADTTRFVAITGSDNATCGQSAPCRHVQHAVDVAGPGDAIRVGPGTYLEQVLVSKPLTLLGAGIDSTVIKGPDVKLFDSFGKTYILEISGPVTVNAARFTVSGPSGPGGGLNCGANPLSLDMGVAVVNGSTLNFGAARVSNIYDIDLAGQENSGCQRGDAISVGKPGGPVTPTVGHARIAGVQVDRFQKDGVAVRTAGSTLDLLNSSITNLPSNVIASNGVEVLDGALGKIQHNLVSGNECNLPIICGPDPINNTESSGILSFSADAGTVIAENVVRANDMGIYTDDGIAIRDNSDSNNRSVGIYVDTDATHAHISGNATSNDGFYGIAIGPLFPVDQGGTGKPNPGGNFFLNNVAFGNSHFDLWQSADAGPNTNRDNRCGTAFPSKQYWDCQGGDQGDTGGPNGGDGGQPRGTKAVVRED